MTKSTAKNSAPKTADTSALATAKESAIETTASEIIVLPINSDVQTAFSSFTARPLIAAGINAAVKTKDGFLAIAAEEKEYEYGRSFIKWLWNVFTALTVPVLALLWLAINKGYVWTRNPETRAEAATKWQSLKDWAAPKFAYETEADRQVELKLND